MKSFDSVLQITTEEAYSTTRTLATEEGIFGGISCGAAACGMLKLAQSGEYSGKNLLAILADTGERYLSTDVWE